MPAAYDQYDYPQYWASRVYEHESETIAVKSFLEKVPHLKTIIDIGAGFGRHTQNYNYRAKTITLADPSGKLLKEARYRLTNYRNIRFIQSRLENLSKKLRGRKFDLAIFIRVLHHISDPEEAINLLDELINPGGYLIIEFANKIHWKQIFKNFLKGNFTYPLDIFPKDLRSKKSIKNKTIPFLNFHPDFIKESLLEKRYKIIETRSVSNVRSSFLKRTLPFSVILWLESIMQHPLAYLKFGPSIFILARKSRNIG